MALHDSVVAVWPVENDWKLPQDFPLLSTCHQIYHETYSLYVALTTIHLDCLGSLMRFHKEVSQEGLTAIRKLYLSPNFVDDIRKGPGYAGWRMYFGGFPLLVEVQLEGDRRQFDEGTLDMLARVLRRATGNPSLRVCWVSE